MRPHQNSNSRTPEPNSQLRRKPTSPPMRPRPQSLTQTSTRASPGSPAEPPQGPRSPRPRALRRPAPSAPPRRPARLRDTESPRSFRPSPSILSSTPNDLHPRVLPGTPRPHSNPTTDPTRPKPVVHPPLPSATRSQNQEPKSREQGAGTRTPATPRRRPTASTTPHRGPPGGSGGSPPGRALRAIGEGQKAPSIVRRRVATGANHPASRSSAFRRGPGTPAVMLRRGTRASI
jgi:hypothetical protein